MPDVQSDSLYHKVGGQTAIEAILGDLYVRVLDDPALSPSFEHADIGELLVRQVAFVSLALGGPQQPMELDLQTDQAHADLEIQARQAKAIARHFTASLHWAGVGEHVAQQILVAVNGLMGDPAQS